MRRKAKCKECGSEIFDYAQNDKTGKPEWECQNCFARTPRQVRKSAKQKKIDKMFKGVFESVDTDKKVVEAFSDYLYSLKVSRKGFQNFLKKKGLNYFVSDAGVRYHLDSIEITALNIMNNGISITFKDNDGKKQVIDLTV